jgi:hypothetical protein
MRLSDSAIDRVRIFAGANQCVILISASIGVTVCPARCLGSIMEPSRLQERPIPSCVDHLAHRESPVDQNEPTPPASFNLSSVVNRCARHSRHRFSISNWSRWSGKLSWLKAARCQRKAASRGANARQDSFVSAYWSRSDVTSAFVLLRPSGIVDMCRSMPSKRIGRRSICPVIGLSVPSAR